MSVERGYIIPFISNLQLEILGCLPCWQILLRLRMFLWRVTFATAWKITLNNVHESIICSWIIMFSKRWLFVCFLLRVSLWSHPQLSIVKNEFCTSWLCVCAHQLLCEWWKWENWKEKSVKLWPLTQACFFQHLPHAVSLTAESHLNAFSVPWRAVAARHTIQGDILCSATLTFQHFLRNLEIYIQSQQNSLAACRRS